MAASSWKSVAPRSMLALSIYAIDWNNKERLDLRGWGFISQFRVSYHVRSIRQCTVSFSFTTSSSIISQKLVNTTLRKLRAKYKQTKAKGKQKGGEFGASTVESCFFWRTLQSLEYASQERAKWLRTLSSSAVFYVPALVTKPLWPIMAHV